MFGPLPWLHQIVLVVVTLCLGVAAGAWVAHATPLPVAISPGALAGGCIGLVAAFLLVHRPQPRPARVVRRR